MIIEKRCRQCETLLPNTHEYFSYAKKATGLLRNQCKLCQNAYAKQRHQTLQKDPAYRAAAIERSRQWVQDNRDRHNARNRAYNEIHPETRKATLDRYNAKPENRAAKYAYNQDYKKRFRREVLMAYGGICTCCGESNLEFLTLEHLDQQGKAHRKELGSTMAVYHWARREGYPKSLTVRCDSCNKAAYWHDGICPHQLEVEALTGIKVVNEYVAALAA